MEGEAQESVQEQEHGLLLQTDGEIVKEDAGDIRRESNQTYGVHVEGCREEALSLADGLVRRHPSSALALHLQGELHRAAGESSGDEDARVAHLCLSMAALTHAAKIAPRCPEIAANLASVRASLGCRTEAESECTRALKVRDPTDPCLHSVCLPPNASSLTAVVRIEAAQNMLQDILAYVRSQKNEPDVPPPASGNVSVIEEVKGSLAAVQHQGTGNAILLAEGIAKMYRDDDLS